MPNMTWIEDATLIIICGLLNFCFESFLAAHSFICEQTQPAAYQDNRFAGKHVTSTRLQEWAEH